MITATNSGLAAERMDRIRGIVRTQRVARVDELAARLSVSPATIRRDLLELDGQGQVHRVHGGAVAAEGRLDEPLFDDKTARAAGEKQRIAQAALAYVKDSASIFLDGGSTVLSLARLLTQRTALTVLTNSLRVAALYSGGGPRMILTGGEFRALSQTLVGYLTRPLIEQLHVDTAFIGTIGLTLEEGLTTTDPREAETKEHVMSRARRVIVLADGSKLGNVSFVRFGAPDKMHVLITDSSAPKALVKKLSRQMEVLTV
jgi:DeoR family fructose operon transcriptional repressor